MNYQDLTILAGDIGGTKTNLAIVSMENDIKSPLAEGTFSSKKYPNLESIIQEFLIGQAKEIHIDCASFGVAGPVIDNRAKITNLPWIIDKSEIIRKFGFSSVCLNNDLLACAYILPNLEANDLYTLNDGIFDPEGSIALVAPGTGLGEAYLTWCNAHYHAFPSEGGHADFAPTNTLEKGLLDYLGAHFNRVSTERVCSGRGLANIYRYLRDTGCNEEPDWLSGILSAVDDPVPVIIESALDGDRSCLLCQSALNMFVHILGTEAGNMALKIMSSGGVYIGGGIPPRIIEVLKKSSFMEAFCHKGRISELMNRIPVHVIMNPKTALLGAARYAMDLFLHDEKNNCI
ncbi:MAG: glucokinase [Smithella sp.]